MHTKIKLMATYFFINMTVVPLIALVLANTSFLVFKPQIMHLPIRLQMNEEKITGTLEKTIKQNYHYFLTFEVPETEINMSYPVIYGNAEIKANKIEYNQSIYKSLTYKSPVFRILDSFLFFPFIHLNFYKQTQILKFDLGKYENLENIRLEFPSRQCISSISLDVLCDANKIQMFFYHHQIIFTCIVFFIIFCLLFTIVGYILALKIREYENSLISASVVTHGRLFRSEDSVNS